MLNISINSKPKDRINSCLDVDGNGSFTVMTTFQVITDILNNKEQNNLEVPPFQASLDVNKIEEMVESFKQCKSHFLSQLLLTIANVKIGNNEINYVMDGQHRMQMIKILYEQYGENMQVILAIHKVKNENMLKQLFNTLNKDSTKNSTYVQMPIFKQQIVDELCDSLNLKFADCCAKNTNKNSHIITVKEFTNRLQLNNFFSKYEKLTVAEMIKKIENDSLYFFNYVGYLENVYKLPSVYYKDEEQIIKGKRNIIFFKNNNFVQYLSSGEEPEHYYTKNTRDKVSVTLREKVWENYFGNQIIGKCPIIRCTCIISKDDKHGFQCGHITSVKNGGNNELSNLRPICANCNSKMSATNWDEFEKIQELNNLNSHDALFEELLCQKKEENIEDECDDMIDCYICTKYLTKEQSKITTVDGIYRLLCEKCCFHNKKLNQSCKI